MVFATGLYLIICGEKRTMEFNFAELHETAVRAIPDREAIVWRDRRLSFAEVGSRTRQLARYLQKCGMGITTEREFLDGHESSFCNINFHG